MKISVFCRSPALLPFLGSSEMRNPQAAAPGRSGEETGRSVRVLGFEQPQPVMLQRDTCPSASRGRSEGLRKC